MMNFGSGFRNFLVREQFVHSLKITATTIIKGMRKIGEMSVFYYEKIKKGCDAYVGIDRLNDSAKSKVCLTP